MPGIRSGRGSRAYPNSPRSPSVWACLAQVHRCCNAGNTISEPKNDSRHYKHGHILGRGLEDDANENDDRAPEQCRPPTEPVAHQARNHWAKEAPDKNRRSVKAFRSWRKTEVVGIRRQDVESIEQTAVKSARGRLNYGAAHQEDGYRSRGLWNPSG